MHHHILEGTWAEVSKKALALNGEVRVRLEVLEPSKPGRLIQKGMFPGLRDLTDDDFRSAEWRGSESA
jgi:hypothetical protein